MDGEKKRKRKKRIVEHANPLFDSWLLEWQKEADKRGSNMKYNFQRARKSLSLYPLPLSTGQDCKLLAHFGSKICHMLDKRLAQHEGEFGAVDWSQVHKMKETPKRGRKKKVHVPTTGSIPTPPITPRNTKLINLHSTGKTCSDKKKINKRQYVPVVRSGAYALLKSLHQASLHPQYQGFMKKDELIAAAQPLCDVSLSMSERVGCYYTGWSSMQTLVKKGLVLRQSHPPRFSLSDEGKALALRLEDAERTIDPMECFNPMTAGTGNEKLDDQSTSRPVPTHTFSSSDSEDDYVMEEVNCSPSYNTCITTPSSQTNSIRGWKDQEEEEDHIAWRQEEAIVGVSCSTAFNDKNSLCPKKPSAHILSAKPPGKLRFSYVTTLGIETPLKDCAGVTVEEDGFIGFLIKCVASDLRESGTSYRTDHTRTANSGFVYAYLSNECAPEQCNGLEKSAGKSSRSPTSKTTVKKPKTKLRKNGLPLLPSEATVATKRKTKTDELHTDVNKETPANICDPPDAVGAATTSTYVPFTLLPENYEIILCIDIAETSGKSAETHPSNKDVILSELRRNGIKYNVRKLHVGDYLWVCQEIRPSLTTDSGISAKETKELVLPVIVERKRMDDLASSIKDGRFKEQKFRLRQCGLSHPVYLVEEDRGSVSGGISLPEMTCLQAVVNTQVINGFTVKVIKGQRESAAYLTIMTRYLQSRYQNKTVSSAKLQDLNESQTNNMSEIETSLLSFSEFNLASMKTQQLTVREMFAKHLLQLYGISADKARAVVDKYGTPGLLMDAYDSEDNTDEVKKLLASLRWGKTGRSLGPVLSASISALYTSKVLR